MVSGYFPSFKKAETKAGVTVDTSGSTYNKINKTITYTNPPVVTNPPIAKDPYKLDNDYVNKLLDQYSQQNDQLGKIINNFLKILQYNPALSGPAMGVKSLTNGDLEKGLTTIADTAKGIGEFSSSLTKLPQFLLLGGIGLGALLLLTKR